MLAWCQQSRKCLGWVDCLNCTPFQVVFGVVSETVEYWLSNLIVGFPSNSWVRIPISTAQHGQNRKKVFARNSELNSVFESTGRSVCHYTKVHNMHFARCDFNWNRPFVSLLNSLSVFVNLRLFFILCSQWMITLLGRPFWKKGTKVLCDWYVSDIW